MTFHSRIIRGARGCCSRVKRGFAIYTMFERALQIKGAGKQISKSRDHGECIEQDDQCISSAGICLGLIRKGMIFFKQGLTREQTCIRRKNVHAC